MTDENEQLTPEEMMEKINRLSIENERLKTDLETTKKDNEKNSVSLQKARELNSQLLNQISVPESVKETPKEEESLEDVLGDCITDALKKYKTKVS